MESKFFSNSAKVGRVLYADCSNITTVNSTFAANQYCAPEGPFVVNDQLLYWTQCFKLSYSNCSMDNISELLLEAQVPTN